VPDIDPPPSGTPRRCLLAVDTLLWRIHPQAVDPIAFTQPAREVRYGGVRFPSPQDAQYRTHRSGDTAQAVVAEVLLRSVPPGSVHRTVRRVAIRDTRMSAIATDAEMELVSLCTGPELASVGQNHWLITAAECGSDRMRRWTRWLREQAPTAAGLIWPPRAAPRDRLVLLFDDRVPASSFMPDPVWSIDLDGEMGAVWLNSVLAPYRARVMPPRQRESSATQPTRVGEVVGH
jgi:hypothetical protein